MQQCLEALPSPNRLCTAASLHHAKRRSGRKYKVAVQRNSHFASSIARTGTLLLEIRLVNWLDNAAPHFQLQPHYNVVYKNVAHNRTRSNSCPQQSQGGWRRNCERLCKNSPAKGRLRAKWHFCRNSLVSPVVRNGCIEMP